MKRFILTASLLLASGTPFAADVGVSISIGEPGFYGRIDIGNAPAPRLLYPQPVLIYRQARAPEPVYLHVPPGHAKNWKKHCKHYDACNRPVYFVQETWYQQIYVPHYQEAHGKGKSKPQHEHHDKGHGDKKNKKDKH